MKKILLISLICFTPRLAHPLNITMRDINTRNTLAALSIVSIAHSLYNAGTEAITLTKLKAKNRTFEIHACQERIKQHGIRTLKATAVLTASRLLSNDSLDKGLKALSLYMLFNRVVD